MLKPPIPIPTWWELTPNQRGARGWFGFSLCLLQEKKYDSFISLLKLFKTISQHPRQPGLMQLGDTKQNGWRKGREDLSRTDHLSYSEWARRPVPHRFYYAGRRWAEPLRNGQMVRHSQRSSFYRAMWIGIPIFSFKINPKLSNDKNGWLSIRSPISQEAF